MRLASNRLSVLLAHGLQESEARVYLALLDSPALTASTLAKAARVPRSYLYNVLQELHSRGLVDILLTGGKRSYRALPFEGFLAREAEQLRERVAQIETEMRTLAGVFRPPPPDAAAATEAGEVRVVLGRRAVAREIEDLLQSAVEHVAIGASPGGVERAGRHLADLLAPTQRGPHVEVYLPPGVAREFLGSEVAASPRLRTSNLRSPLPALAFVADRTRMLTVHPLPDSEDLRHGRDLALFTSDPAFVQSWLQLLRDASASAEP